MYPQLNYYYLNREKILQKNYEKAMELKKENEKWGVRNKKGGGRPLTINPLKLMSDYEKITFKKKEKCIEVKKGNFSIDFD